MNQPVNRIAEALKMIEARHNRLKKQFSPEIFNSRAFKKEQMREMAQLRNRFKSGLNSEEKTYRKLLNARRKQLEKELYPNVYIRLARNFAKLSGQALVMPIRIVSRYNDAQKTTSNLERKGLQEISNAVKQHIKQGQDKFSIPTIRTLNDGSELKYHFQFEKQGRATGIERIKLSNKETSVVIPEKYARLNAEKLNNLLQGSAIRGQDGKWLTLNLTDKDAQGNFKTTILNPENFVIKDLIGKLGANNFSGGKIISEVAKKLEDGESVKVNINGQEVTISADPKAGKIIQKDEKGKLITLQHKENNQSKVVSLKPKIKETSNGLGM